MNVNVGDEMKPTKGINEAEDIVLKEIFAKEYDLTKDAMEKILGHSISDKRFNKHCRVNHNRNERYVYWDGNYMGKIISKLEDRGEKNFYIMKFIPK